jgi:predicted NUDIX family NTP pyrophosphohydrolase
MHRFLFTFSKGMKNKVSAGILLFRKVKSDLEVFIVHPGGPFWKNKDEGAWSIPKGEIDDGGNPLQTAIREFEEETGTRVSGNFIELHPVRLKSGKLIHAWALEGEMDASKITSNYIDIEWPPRSGKKLSIPEVDRAQWFTLEQASHKLNTGQVPLLKDLQQKLDKK